MSLVWRFILLVGFATGFLPASALADFCAAQLAHYGIVVPGDYQQDLYRRLTILVAKKANSGVLPSDIKPYEVTVKRWMERMKLQHKVRSGALAAPPLPGATLEEQVVAMSLAEADVAQFKKTLTFSEFAGTNTLDYFGRLADLNRQEALASPFFRETIAALRPGLFRSLSDPAAYLVEEYRDRRFSPSLTERRSHPHVHLLWLLRQSHWPYLDEGPFRVRFEAFLDTRYPGFEWWDKDALLLSEQTALSLIADFGSTIDPLWAIWTGAGLTDLLLQE